jgi:hypothetical protein
MIAALFVQKNGVYWNLEDVDPWDEVRDARNYVGPWPVVAHPPCERWGRYYWGGPTIARFGRPHFEKGDDNGCFDAALALVRRWGGVLEHPEGSSAWDAFGLIRPPRCGGWIVADWHGGWSCCVEQGAYGHRARKATWLYANGVELPSLRWGPARGKFDLLDAHSRSKTERARLIRTGICRQLSKRQRAATPIEFRNLLLSMVRAGADRRAD